MNKSLVFILFSAILVGCSDLPTVPSATKLVSRNYVMTDCRMSQFEDEAVPCTSYTARTYYYVTDSAHLLLRNDGTASWLRAEHRCDIGQPCTATSAVVDSLSGSYHFGHDSLVVHFAATTSGGEQDLLFTGTVPEEVSDDWAGPDVLSFSLSNGAWFGVFKPQ
jgi:hypothetical protein